MLYQPGGIIPISTTTCLLCLSQIQAMAEDVQPMLAEVRQSGLLQEVESLTRSLTQASEDLR